LLEKLSIDVPMNEHLDEVFNDDVATVTQKLLNTEIYEDSVSK